MRSILYQSGMVIQLKNGNVSNYNSFPITSSMILSLFYQVQKLINRRKIIARK